MNEIKNVKYRSSNKAIERTFSKNMSVMWESFLWKFKDVIANWIANAGNVLLVSGPFVMLLVGEFVFAERGYWAIGGEVILPFVFVIVGFALKSYARVSGKDRSDIPVPYRRFTNVDYNSGQVDVEYDRAQEMILYMADLEDWFDRNGYHD